MEQLPRDIAQKLENLPIVSFNNANELQSVIMSQDFLDILTYYEEHYMSDAFKKLQEIQANAAESTYEISTFIKEDENWGQYSNSIKISMLDVYLKRTEGYKKYSVIKNVFLPFIKAFDEYIKEKIFMIFKSENYNITEKEYNDFVKQIEFSCKRALSKMNRGLVKYYEEYNLN